MRQQFARVSFGIVLGVALLALSPTATAAPEPTVTALVEGRDVASGRSTLVLVGILVPVVIASYQVVTLLFQFDQRSDALQFPMWIPQGVVPVSLTLIILLALARLVDPKAPDAPPDEHGYD